MHAEAELPFRLNSRQFVDFSGNYAEGLARLRNYLGWTSTAQSLLKRHADAEYELARAHPARRRRKQQELDALNARIGELRDWISSPEPESQLMSQAADELGIPPAATAHAGADQPLRGDDVSVPGTAVALPAALRRYRSPLCGRDAELRQMTAWWDGPGTGVRACVLSGEAGIGKTRLAAELSKRAHVGGARVLYGRSDDYGRRDDDPRHDDRLPVPYQPIVESVRHLLTQHPRLMESETLTDEISELARLVPELRSAGISVQEPPAADPQLRRYRIFEAVTALLTRAAGDAGLLLVLDDLQWADEPTSALLRHLLRAEADGRLGVLVIHRAPELSADHSAARTLSDASRDCPLVRVALSGLDDLAVTRLVGAHASAEATPGFIALLSEHTSGNPFFVEEIMLSLRDTAREEDRPLRASDLVGLGVPESIKALLERRLAQLDGEAVQTLSEAAAIGLEFDLEVLEWLDTERNSLSALERATDAGIVIERTKRRFAFTHALVHRAVYTRQSLTRRARTHERIAHLLASHPHLGASYDDLARHWDAAGEPQPALEAALAAARAAADVGAFNKAHAHYERALELWPEVREAGTELEVIVAAAEAARWSGEPDRASDLIQKGLSLLDSAPGPAGDAQRARLEERLGRYLWESGDWKESRSAYERALRLLPDRTDLVERARALAGHATMLMFGERFEESMRSAESALAIARSLGARREEGHALNTYGVDLGMTGRIEHGLSSLREALDIAREVDSLEDECRAHCNLTELLTRAGRTVEAVEVGLAGYEFTRQHGLERSGAPIIAANAIAALARVGRWDQARALADESLALGVPDGVGAFLRLTCAELSVVRGDTARAEAELAASAPIVAAADKHEPTLPAEHAEVAAELALQQGDYARARAAVEAALTALEDTEEGEMTLRACVLGLRIAATAGDAEEWALDLAERAHALAQSMAASGVLLPVAGALARAAAAEWAQLLGEPCADAWADAGRAFAAVDDTYATARAALAQAKACHAEGRGTEGAMALKRSRALARQLGAEPLLQEIDRASMTALTSRSTSP